MIFRSISLCNQWVLRASFSEAQSRAKRPLPPSHLRCFSLLEKIREKSQFGGGGGSAKVLQHLSQLNNANVLFCFSGFAKKCFQALPLQSLTYLSPPVQVEYYQKGSINQRSYVTDAHTHRQTDRVDKPSSVNPFQDMI